MGHLVGENFVDMSKIKSDHVPYKGASQALTDLVGGHIVWCSQTLTSTSSFLRARIAERPRRRPATSGCPTGRTSRPSRSKAIDLVASIWFALSGPAKLPPAIAQEVNQEVNKAMSSPRSRRGCGAME